MILRNAHYNRYTPTVSPDLSKHHEALIKSGGEMETGNRTRVLDGSTLGHVHVYGLAICWFLLGLYTFITGINIRAQIPHKGLVNRMCAHLCMASILRAVYFLVDPYESRGRLPDYVSRPLYVSLQPLLLATFHFLFLALIRLTAVHVKPRFIESSLGIEIFAISWISILVIGEFSAHFYPSNNLGLVNCGLEFVYILLHGFTALSFFHYGTQMLRRLGRPHKGSQARCYKVKRGDPHALSTLSLPKIRITDENECTLSYKSDASSFQSETPSEQEFLEPPNPDSSNDQPVRGEEREASNGGSHGRKRRKKKRHTRWTRSRRLRLIIRASFLHAGLALFQCAWMGYERVGHMTDWDYFTSTPLSPHAWLLIMTIYRIVEISWAITMGYLVRHGFNRL